MFGALHCMAQGPGHYGNWSGGIWIASKCGAGGEWRILNGQRKQRIGEERSL